MKIKSINGEFFDIETDLKIDNQAKATPIKVWKYKRNDCPSFESEVKMTIETETDLIKEFGGIREYLNSMISGGVRITDHYLLANATK